MSFWTGVASGFKDAEASKERAEERALRQEDREYARDYQERMFSYKQKQDDYVRERQGRMDKLAIEDRNLARIKELLPHLAQVNPGLVSAFGGEGSSSGGVSPMDPTAIAVGSGDFAVEFNGLTAEQKKDPFFGALAQSKDGQAAVKAFMKTQATKGNTVELKDIPKFFKYVGATPGSGKAEKKEFLSGLVDGAVDISDTPTFVKGLIALSQYKPVKHLFRQIDAPMDDRGMEVNYNNFKTRIVNAAFRAAEGLPKGERKDAILNAVSAVEKEGNEVRGIQALVGLGIGSDLNEPDNPLIADFYSVAEEPAPQPEAPAAGAGARPTEIKVFPNVAAAEEARLEGSLPETYHVEGFYGKGGQLRLMRTVTPPEEASGEVPTNTSEATPPKPTRGSSINRVFTEEEVFGQGNRAERRGPPPTNSPDVLGSRTQSDVDELQRAKLEKQAAVSRATNRSNRQNAATLRQVSAVKGDLEESGLVWPTNEQELEEYISGVDEAIDNFGPLPEEVYNMLIDQATQNVQN
jgi:hypothetical protein